MARSTGDALQVLIKLRRARMLQAQNRLAQVKFPAEEANREVLETQALLQEYALRKLGTVAVSAIRRQQLFAGKVHELVLSRQQQATRLNEETSRRDVVWRQSLTRLRSAEKVLELVQERERVAQERKLRRRSIHRSPASGRWTDHNDSN